MPNQEEITSPETSQNINAGSEQAQESVSTSVALDSAAAGKTPENVSQADRAVQPAGDAAALPEPAAVPDIPGEDLTWEAVQDAFIYGKNGFTSIREDIGKIMIDQADKDPQSFIDIINQVHNEEDTGSDIENGSEDSQEANKGISKSEAKRSMIKFFYEKLVTGQDRKPYEKLDTFVQLFNKGKASGSQPFYPKKRTLKNQGEVFLIIRNNDYETSGNHIVIINPFYKKDESVPSKAAPSGKKKRAESEIAAEEFEQLFPEQNSVKFEFRIKFLPDQKLPENLKDRTFEIPVIIQKPDKQIEDIIITGRQDNVNGLRFGLYGNISPNIRAQRLWVDWTASGSNDKKPHLIQYQIFDPESPSSINYFIDYRFQSDSNYKKVFQKINSKEKYIGQFFFPDNITARPTIEVVSSSDTGKVTDEARKTLTELIKAYWIVYSSNWKFPALPETEQESVYNNYPVLGKMLTASLWLSVLWDINNSSCSGDIQIFEPQLPKITELYPARKVDLHPFELKDLFEDKNLYYQPSALNSLAMALNSGGHVILTGPPGAGKTELATQLPDMLATKQGYILCTASPDWTTNELIGRYMPMPNKGEDGEAILEFQPGFFLQAIEDGKWLIIDELNRADIDSCMGPLFSVLSGQPVLLPYKIHIKASDGDDSDSESGPGEASDSSPENNPDNMSSSGDDSDSGCRSENGTDPASREKTGNHDSGDDDSNSGWRQIGICLESSENLDDSIYWYKVPDDFRIICTMNDSDAGMLNQLSYALQRRFSVIRIEAPGSEAVGKWIKDKIKDVCKEYNEKLTRRFPPADDLEAMIAAPLKALFANGKAEDLMRLRVVGFGQVRDIISMVIEGLSCPESYQYEKMQNEDIENLLYTLLANGVVMKVFPQLSAFARDRDRAAGGTTFGSALKCIADVFRDRGYYELQAENNTLKIVSMSSNSLFAYLEGELQLLFRNQYVEWQDDWKDAMKETTPVMESQE